MLPLRSHSCVPCLAEEMPILFPRSVVLLGSTTSLPGDVAELHSNALRHAPLLGEHAPVLLLIVHQLTFDPRVAPVYLIQPGNLRRRTPPLTAAAVNNSRSAQIHARLKISSCTKVLLKTQPNDNPFCPTIRFVSLRGSREQRDENAGTPGTQLWGCAPTYF